MDEDQRWQALLTSASTVPLKNKRLSRVVVKLSFDKSHKYLFTSGSRNRCNPAGVFCIYMAEDRETALAEFDKYFTDQGDEQPYVTYTGRLTAGAMIDLGDPKTRSHFGLGDTDFFTPFRTKKDETLLEKLGRAISKQKKIVAIRFPSDAMHAKGREGCNIVIYKNSLEKPDHLKISGPDKETLEEWPEV